MSLEVRYSGEGGPADAGPPRDMFPVITQPYDDARSPGLRAKFPDYRLLWAVVSTIHHLFRVSKSCHH